MTTASGTSRLLFRSLQGVLRENTKFCSRHFGTREFEEIKFNVPWGHISGKWYGPREVRPIVGFHGWQDNSGTFDPIAPLLPAHLSFLAVDLPGHGLSSWIPDGCAYHEMDYVTIMLTLMREFNWDKISMISHSMSSLNSFVFCSLFPDKCDMFIALDVLKPVAQSVDIIIDRLSDRLGNFHKFDERNRSQTKPPCYDFDQLVEKLHVGSGKSIEKENCPFILKRNIRPSAHDPNKYYFNLDNRLKVAILYSLRQDMIVEMARRITCPHLVIRAITSPYFEDKSNFDEVLNLLTQKPNFEYYELDSTHHVHLNEPQKIANIINPFINKYRPE